MNMLAQQIGCDTQTEKTTILLVDDEINVLKALGRLFFEDNYKIITAQSGEEGLKILEQERAQIVISDYRMPSMSGVDFLSEVCNRWPETVRIVLSGYADTASIISAVNEGQIYKFISKPWNDEDLKVTVANAIERYFLCMRNTRLTLELKAKTEELSRLNAELTRLLKKEKDDLAFQNRVLSVHQTILDRLPVGIIGIAGDDTVIMCNEGFVDVTKNTQFPLDQDIRHVLPDEVIDLVAEVKNTGKATKMLQLYGVRGRLLGMRIEHDSSQVGIILIFVREDNAQ